ncbi:MAG: glycosyltransferase family 2 protein [Anaerolineales bacterium]|nr:glycosyltransferase family 2 protein [Anaerolineales bacterium]
MTMFVSVVIPTYKRVESLVATLKSVVAQRATVKHEILILDNDCDPRLEYEVRAAAQVSDAPTHYYCLPEIGLHNGRHAGARKANGDVIVYLDDDVITAEGWLQAIAETFQDPDVHLVGGRNLPLYEQEPPEWMGEFWEAVPGYGKHCGTLSLLDFGENPMDIDPMFVWGLNFAIRKETLLSLGGFHPDAFPWELRRYRGDGETAVAQKVIRLGLRAVYQPAALVYHAVPNERMTVEYFEKRAYLQGISNSFADTRAQHGSLEKSKVRRAASAPSRMVKSLLENILKRSNLSQDRYCEIKERVAKAYQSGYEYHQNEVRNDPTLLAWVLKEDYWDAVP